MKKNDFWKKAIVGIAIVVVGSMISSGVTGLINEKKTDTDENVDTETQACIECVIDA